ncbi:exodeoxyribonuclease VII large subunit [Altericista sp. CCNU0014]|uniref:exodeoxyribonuclease VII large subunit n=1 Tax=Altericista sp. CCNU0014 TaxID=3082949 RepID=UPI00384F75B2
MDYLPNLLMPPAVLSVGGLTGYIQSLLEQDEQLVQVWLTGEVSSANRYRSGLFFTLRDPDEEATLQCVVWSASLEKLVVVPEPGEQVIVLGRIRLYPQRGQYQLAVWQVLSAGEGLRALRYQQMRDRLAAEGVFDPERKRPIPVHPQAIGVVTSPQAAAWGDIQRTLKSRYPGLRVLFSPSLVQGDRAPESIAQALAWLEADGRAEAIILARGGGASEDLACFNDERVVRAIATCRIPIVSGIGHQRDETLADLAADCCAHTPTAAATVAVPCLEDLQALHFERRARLFARVESRAVESQKALQRLETRLQRIHPERRVQQELSAISSYRHRLLQAASYRLRSQQQHQQFLQEKLATLDPRAVLRRGYAIARTLDGTIARKATDLSRDQTFSLQLGDGSVRAKVLDLSED